MPLTVKLVCGPASNNIYLPDSLIQNGHFIDTEEVAFFLKEEFDIDLKEILVDGQKVTETYLDIREMGSFPTFIANPPK